MQGKDPALAAAGRTGCCRWQGRDAELAAPPVWDLRHTHSMARFTGWEWDEDTGRRQLVGEHVGRNGETARRLFQGNS